MSLPGRIGTCRSAIALVRVKRGSTWMTFAPRSLASITHCNPTRVLLGHVRAHDQDVVGVLQVLLERGRAATPERDPQTGNRRAMSYPRLVLDRHRAHRGEALLQQVVLLAVERRPAEQREPTSAIQRLAVLGLRLPRLLPRRDDPVGDHFHRGLEVELLLRARERMAVFSLGLAQRRVDQLLGRSALRTQPPARDRRIRIALDLHDATFLRVDLLATADRAI